MNSQSKAYSIILYLIWPFSALLIGLKNFDSHFGKKLVIALYAFLGFTAVSVGDLERYESEFYDNKSFSFDIIVNNIVSLQDGKIFYTIVSYISGLFFESHHYYFLILFLIYGFFYVNTVFLLKEVTFNKLGKLGMFFFFGMLLFLFIRPIINTAYYTGGVYLLFLIVSYHKTNNKRYLWFLLLVPLFHIGLAIYLIIPPLLFLFKNKTWYYIIFVGVTFIIGKSTVVALIEDAATTNSGTIIESKYKNYASEEGQEYLDTRYKEGDLGSNIKLKSLNFLTELIMYIFVPLGIFLLFLKRKYLLVDEKSVTLFHIVLLFWGISNLMLNISQGSRFVVLYTFLSIAAFYVVYIKTRHFASKTFFYKFLYTFIPILLLCGLMLAYASNELILINFFISNFIFEVLKVG